MVQREPSIPFLSLERMMLEESFQENIYKGENSAVLLTEGVSLFSVNVPYIDPVVASVNQGVAMPGTSGDNGHGTSGDNGHGRSCAELSPTILYGENLMPYNVKLMLRLSFFLLVWVRTWMSPQRIQIQWL
ncbi:hypothetical protein ACOSP7_031811 [Xanthoceras sorbifolium]